MPKRFAVAALFHTALVWCWSCTAAFAQEAEEAATKENWTLSYVLVVLAIALGLAVVCRPGTRLVEFRRTEEDDDE